MLEDHYGIHPVGTGQMDDLLARAKRAGLDKVVVHSAATTPAQVVPANNWAIRIHREHPEVLAFGTVHPDYAGNERELERLWRSGIQGIKFHADFQGFRLDDPKLWPIFESLSGRFIVMDSGILVWDDSLRIGIKDIDAQHQILVRMICDLHEAMAGEFYGLLGDFCRRRGR